MLIPYHEARDEDKVRRLAESMERDGWTGAPIVVVDSEYALTGVHRIAAWRSLGLPDYEIPTVELSELFAEAGVDMEEAWEAWGRPTIDDATFPQFINNELPEEIREKYGLDMH